MSKQIQYFSPTNLANYRERCKRKRIFIQRIYANSFKYCKYWKELNLPILLQQPNNDIANDCK